MSIFDMLQRPLVIIIAAVLLGEAIDLTQVAGIVMVLAGVQLARVQRVVKT